MNNSVSDQVRDVIRDIPDFPKPGILFKDITPLLADPELSKSLSYELARYWESHALNGVVGIESRGFIYGMQLAQLLGVAFIPIRKAGKLPYETIRHAYDLEYGSAEIEVHSDAIRAGDRILVHDDLLATGGTANAAGELVVRSGGEVAGYSFLVELDFLHGRQRLNHGVEHVHSVVHY